MQRNLCILACFFLLGAWYAGAGDSLRGESLWSASPSLFWGCAFATACLVPWLGWWIDKRQGGAGRRDSRLAFTLAFAVTLVAGYARYGSWERACEGSTLCLVGKWIKVRGVVADAPVVTGRSLRFKMSLLEDSLQGRARGLLVVRLVAGDGGEILPVRYGDFIEVQGVARRPRPATNPGGFDRAAWLRVQGVTVELQADGAYLDVLSRGGGNPLVRAAAWCRERLEKAADSSLPPDQASLLKGIVLGSRSSLPEQVEEDFRHAGIYHILSVSGLHVGFIFGSVTALLRRLNVPKKNATMAGLLILPAYALLTGLKPPVLRAAIMAVPVHLGPYVQRKADSPTSLALASVLVVAMWPGALFDPGFHLSFGATAGLIALSSRVESALAFLPRAVRGPLAMTVAAQAAIAPVVVRQFQEVSLVSFVVNPVVVPVVGWCTTLGSAAMMLGSFWPGAGFVANLPNRLLLRFVLAATSLAVKAPASFFYARPPSVLESVAYCAVLWLVYVAYPPDRLAEPRVRRRLAIVALSAVMGISLLHATGSRLSRDLRIVFLDVGQGDAALITAPGGKTILVDAGPPGRDGGPSAGKSVILPCLRWFGITSLDAVIVTHFHDDHYGGLRDVLSGVPCGALLVPPGGTERAMAAAAAPRTPAMEAAVAQVPVVEVYSGYSWEMGGVKFEVLHPPRNAEWVTDDCAGKGGHGAGNGAAGWDAGDDGSSENDNSVVLMITCGEARILMTGDAGVAAEEVLLDKRVCATVLKVGHHGSNLSSSATFLAAVSPQTCVVSVGPNSYGLPARRAMERLRAACPTVLRTDECGAVTVTMDGRAISVRMMINNSGRQSGS